MESQVAALKLVTGHGKSRQDGSAISHMVCSSMELRSHITNFDQASCYFERRNMSSGQSPLPDKPEQARTPSGQIRGCPAHDAGKCRTCPEIHGYLPDKPGQSRTVDAGGEA